MKVKKPERRKGSVVSEKQVERKKRRMEREERERWKRAKMREDVMRMNSKILLNQKD